MNRVVTLTAKKAQNFLVIFLMVIIVGSHSSIIKANEWSKISSGTNLTLESVAYYDKTGTLIAVGNGVILRSTDLGRTWATVLNNSIHFYSVQFSKNGKVHAVGSNTSWYYSNDNGVTWKSGGSSGTTTYYAAAFPTNLVVGTFGAGVIVGSWPYPKFTWDDGTTWNNSSTGFSINKNYFGATFNGYRMIIVGGSGEIWVSTNYGDTWAKKSSGVTNQLRCVISDYLKETNLFACGNDGVVLESTNSGDTWQKISPPGLTNLNSIVSTSTGPVVVGAGGIILNRQFGNWYYYYGNSSSSLTTNDLNGIVATKNSELVAVGANGTILLWSAPAQETPYKGVAATVPGRVEAENYNSGGNGLSYYDLSVGNATNLYRNDDVDIDISNDISGGYTVGWIDTGEWLKYTINAKQAGTHTVVARVASALYSGQMRITINGNDSKIQNIPYTGSWQTWKDVNFGQFILNAGLNTIKVDCLIQAYNFNYIDVTYGITSVKDNEELPEDYKLGQNYPNPFNPSTTINYSIPQSSFVTIKVYDLLGREVSSLVNQTKAGGNYSVQFNAAKLQSGIYYYSIQAGSFTQTKKLMLLK